MARVPYAIAAVLFLHALHIVGASVYFHGNGQGYTSVPEGIFANTTNLILHHNDITFLDPERLSHIQALRVIDVSNNKLMEFPDLCLMDSLVLFFIRYNANPLNVTKERLSCFRNLGSFYADWTEFISFPDFSNIGSLKVLQLSGTRSPEVIADHLQNLTALHTMSLAENQLTSVPTLPSLPALKMLSLANNQLTEIPLLGDLPSLSTLYLNGNGLSEIPDLCQSASNLEKLVLESNPIATFNQTRLGCLKNLFHLNLRNTSARNISHLSFIDISSTLKELLLGLNNITFLPHFPNMTNLTLLDINDCENLNLPWDYFIGQNWTSLTTLSIGGLANKVLPDLSELGTTLVLLHMTPLDVASLDVTMFAYLTEVRDLKAGDSPSSFLPTTCPSDPSGMSVTVSGSALDLCAANNLWLKMLVEAGGSVQADDRTCGSHLWSTMTVNELIDLHTDVPGKLTSKITTAQCEIFYNSAKSTY